MRTSGVCVYSLGLRSEVLVHQLEVALPLLTVDRFRVHTVCEHCGRNRVRVHIERLEADVVEGVARQVVTRVVLVTGRAAPDGGLFGGLDDFGAGE